MLIVNVPLPLHPDVVPLSAQVPLITLLLTVPCSVSKLFVLPVDWIFIWKPPDVTPFWFPLRVNPPVAVDPEAKQGLAVVKFKFVMLTPFPPL